VGVVRDFNYRSLHSKIEPVALTLNPEFISAISVRTEKGSTREAIEFVKQKWADIFPEEIFEFNFLDTRISQLYYNEIKMRNVFIIFSFFSVFVACLGLFGLSVFITTDRTKEIGIRKVMGATSLKIFFLLSKEFFTWLIIANIFAWPLAWIFIKNWLQNFAFQTEIGIWLFLAPAALALFIALTTLSIQVLRAALANPVISLRYE
jgi:putative ABC transport system permease protein